MDAWVYPAAGGSRVVVAVPPGHLADPVLRTARRMLLVAVTDGGDGSAPGCYGVDGRWARRRLAGAQGPARVAVPRAYALDDLTLGILWAVANMDEYLLADDALLGHLPGAHRRLRTAATVRGQPRHRRRPGHRLSFASPTGGPLGYLVEGRLRLANRLGHRTVLPRPDPGSPPPRVGLVTMVLGDDGLLLERQADHLDGLVVAGFGVGHAPARLVPLLGELAGRIPVVVVASRTGAGSVATATYGFPGSERDLLGRGLVAAGFLHPLEARILLHALLTAGCDRTAITAAFGVAGGYADPRTWPWPDLTDPAPTPAPALTPGAVRA